MSFWASSRHNESHGKLTFEALLRSGNAMSAISWRLVLLWLRSKTRGQFSSKPMVFLWWIFLLFFFLLGCHQHVGSFSLHKLARECLKGERTFSRLFKHFSWLEWTHCLGWSQPQGWRTQTLILENLLTFRLNGWTSAYYFFLIMQNIF